MKNIRVEKIKILDVREYCVGNVKNDIKNQNNRPYSLHFVIIGINLENNERVRYKFINSEDKDDRAFVVAGDIAEVRFEEDIIDEKFAKSRVTRLESITIVDSEYSIL